METHNCDECGKILNLGIPIEVNFGYGTIFDGTRVEFCSIDCIINYSKALKEKNNAKN